MAEAKKKRRVIKNSETVREKRAKAVGAEPKQRRVHQAASKANKPLRSVGRAIAKIAKPFGFILIPFRTRPAKFVGRILSKVFFIGYFKNSWKELRLVEWPNRRETIKLTLAVFIFAIGFALIIALLDYGLDKLFKQLLV